MKKKCKRRFLIFFLVEEIGYLYVFNGSNIPSEAQPVRFGSGVVCEPTAPVNLRLR